MPNVRRLADYRHRDTVQVLQHLLARAERGELEALAICARPVSGREEFAFTGTYRRSADAAAAASIRLSRFLIHFDEQGSDDVGSY